MDNGIKNYTLDCGCFFEYSKKAGCASFELTIVCDVHSGTPLSSGAVTPHGKLPPNPFLTRPQAGDVTHRVTAMADWRNGDNMAVQNRMSTLGELLGDPLDDRNRHTVVDGIDVFDLGGDPMEHTQPIPPPHTYANRPLYSVRNGELWVQPDANAVGCPLADVIDAVYSRLDGIEARLPQVER